MVPIKRKFNSLMYRIALRGFRFLERTLGIHVTPVHYYSPIPDTRTLGDDVFESEFSMTGVDMNDSVQTEWLKSIAPRYVDEYTPAENTGLSLVDSAVLYAMIRERKPRIMVEIGSGESTRISLQALTVNREEGHPCQFIAVEPYPSSFLQEFKQDWFTLIQEKVENVDVDLLSQADILFIDSSHVSRIGSDVNYELLELVPRLKKGALIHWHDIMIPGNYWRDWTMDGNKFWNESYLLHAFLLFNKAYDVRWASRYTQEKHQQKVQQAFPYFSPLHRNTSFWIERVK